MAIKPKGKNPSVFKRKFQESERRYLSLLEHLPVGVYRTTPEGRIIEANHALADILGFESRSGLKNVNVKSLYVEQKERTKHLKRLKTDGSFFAEFELKRRDGGTIWGRDYPSVVLDRQGRIAHYDGILVDITREKKAEENLRKAHREVLRSNRERQKIIKKLESLSLHDDLTGLYNRRGFFTIAREYLQLAVRRKEKMFLLFMDLDNLKKINDTFGHRIGDLALQKIAEILNKTFRSSDIKGRMGGDEFAVFPIDSTLSGVAVALKRMNEKIEAFNAGKEVPIKLGISTGVSCFDPDYPCSVDELLVRADKLMYEQKRSKQK